jgi:hypothetical protein
VLTHRTHSAKIIAVRNTQKEIDMALTLIESFSIDGRKTPSGSTIVAATKLNDIAINTTNIDFAEHYGEVNGRPFIRIVMNEKEDGRGSKWSSIFVTPSLSLQQLVAIDQGRPLARQDPDRSATRGSGDD